MRDLANRPELLSLNCATVRQRWNLRQIVDGCQRHGIRAKAQSGAARVARFRPPRSSA